MPKSRDHTACGVGHCLLVGALTTRKWTMVVQGNDMRRIIRNWVFVVFCFLTIILSFQVSSRFRPVMWAKAFIDCWTIFLFYVYDLGGWVAIGVVRGRALHPGH